MTDVPDVDYKALIRSSRRPERTVPLCMRGDLVAQFEELDRQLAATVVAAASKASDRRLNGNPAAVGQAIAEQMAALQEQMRSSTVPFRLRALRPARWAELGAEHPPRKGEDGKVLDADSMGVNSATFFGVLVRESVIAPKLDDDDWAVLLGQADDATDDEAGAHGLSDHQFDQLASAAWGLNRREVDIPFSRAASRILLNSDSE